jgi:hypothetical protein
LAYESGRILVGGGLGNAEADTQSLTRNMIDAFKTVMTT